MWYIYSCSRDISCKFGRVVKVHHQVVDIPAVLSVLKVTPAT